MKKRSVRLKTARPKTTPFPVVGIGGSAGGIVAFQELLKKLSDKPGLAIVFIMHLPPKYKSMLPELLIKSTKMPVSEVKNNTLVKANHVYVIPPGNNVSITKGKLTLKKRNSTDLKERPIDYFFRSLAGDQENNGIGVILSGTATDGTLGAEAIKAEAGIVFAQDESAEYDGMPKSAIATGCVDFVLSPKKIAAELERMAKHPSKLVVAERKDFEEVFDILRSVTGLDLTNYKVATVNRRISRRILLLNLKNIKDYVKILREDKREVETLCEDLLIKVTSFFRDPKVFDTLKKKILPTILKSKKRNQEIRIWVPGCSSGEEVYSIAICLAEVLENKKRVLPVHIYATDVSEIAIKKARCGIYGKNIKDNVTHERLKKFFTKTGDSYQISKQLRGMCIFSKQNVFSDPPFSNIDLISCRNILIYFQPIIQKKVFYNFHYSLRPGGFLLLGSSEVVSGYLNFFDMQDKKQRFFVKKHLSIKPQIEPSSIKKLEIMEGTNAEKGKEGDIADVIDQIVLREYVPCGVLINRHMEIVQYRGQTGCFLESSTGKPSLDIFKLAREGLRLPLRAAIFKAKKTKHTVRTAVANIKYNDYSMLINVVVVPIKTKILKEESYMILFDEINRSIASKKTLKIRGRSIKDERYIVSIEKELSETKEDIQTIIEEQESTNEEIRTANEEILSSNEELQSANEELETAREELQSSNEELITTNEELRNRNVEVSILNSDLINILSSINMPIVMTGTDLVVRKINLQAEKVLNVIPSDVGRSISKIRLNLDIPDLEKKLTDVIESAHPKVFEIQNREGLWYSVYIRPYLTTDNKIDGVVMIFVDITENKKAEDLLNETGRIAKIGGWELDVKTLELTFTKEVYNIHEIDPLSDEPSVKDAINFYTPESRPIIEKAVDRAIKYGEPYDLELEIITAKGNVRAVHAIGKVVRENGKTKLVCGTFQDITESKKTEDLLRESEEKIRVLLDSAAEAIYGVDLNCNCTFYNKTFLDLLGYRPADEILGKNIHQLIHSKHPDGTSYPAEECQISQAFISGKSEHVYDEVLWRFDGTPFPTEYWTCPQYRDGELIGSVGSFIDITERNKAEAALKESEETLRLMFENAEVGILLADAESKRFLMSNKTIQQMLGYDSDEIARLGVMDIHPEKDLPYVLGEFEKQLSGEIKLSKDMPVKRKDGSVFYADVNATTITIAGRKHLMGFFTDVTEIRKMDELRATSLYTRSLIEASIDPLVTISTEGKITDVNKSMAKATGLSREELIGSGFSGYFTEPEKAIAGYKKVLSDGEARDYPLTLKHKSGSATEVLLNAVVYKDQANHVQGIFAAARDITELKKAEKAFREAQESLVNAANVKEEFLSIVSHDLKSPLNIIKRSTTMILEEPDIKDAVKEKALLTLRQANRGLKYVDNLLSLRRLKSGDVTLDTSRFHFFDLVDDVVKDYNFDSEDINIRLEVFRDVDYEVSADYEKISHIVSNIIENAIKYTPKGGSISIRASLGLNDLKVSITDTGVGIPPEKLEKIFEYYEQVSTTDRETGTGMGLAIARYLCELHGGRIWAESSVEKGSTFNFIIPNARISTSRTAKMDLSEKNILIVDDIADERTLTRNLLERDNFKVIEADGWKEALDKIHSGKIDVVLLDIQMPDMSGMEFLKLIRREKGQHSLPIIIYSGKTFDPERYIKHGANSCVNKGDDTDKLLNAIKKIFTS